MFKKILIIIWIMVLPLLLFSFEDMMCNYCHGNVFGVSKLQSKEEWKVLTSDDGKQLQEIHQYNLGVLAYLQSEYYDQKELYDYVSFHANYQRDIIVKENIKECTKCHKDLKNIWSRKSWLNLTSLDPLKEAHKENLDVLKVLDSKKFMNVLTMFIETMQSNAPSVVEKEVLNIEERCIKCHDRSMDLSNLWSKNQWDDLLKSLDTLKTIHKNELKVIPFIESDKFKKYLADFIESIKFQASDRKKDSVVSIYSKENYKKIELKIFEFKDEKTVFTYKKMDGEKEEAEKIYKRIKEYFDKCNIDTPITLKLRDNGWSTVGSDVIMWVLTLSLSDIRSSMSVTLEATQNGKSHLATQKITNTMGWFNNTKESDTVFTVLEKLMQEIEKELMLTCTP
ncbi:MAG: hypothetical protein U9O24_03615 [Campylobacterota bacterium]|nr:hypothetical protein [Campylobacterota bacterium]